MRAAWKSIATTLPLVAAVASSCVLEPIRTVDEPLEPEPPRAEAGLARTGQVGVPMTFDGSLSVDPDGEIVEFLWTFGDGSSAAGVEVPHTFEAPGTYVVQLLIVDDQDLEDRAEVIVTIEGEVPEEDGPPIALGTVTPAEDVRVGDVLTFDASESVGAFEVVAWRWSFGDGSAAEGEVVEHAYETVGTFTVVLEVEDAVGQVDTEVDTVTIAPLDIDGTWALDTDQLAFGCNKYNVYFEHDELTFTAHDDGSLTAMSSTGREFEGTLTGANFSVAASYVGETGGTCSNAPVDATFTGSFSAEGALEGTFTAYYDLGPPCQCSASWPLTGQRMD